MRRFGTHGPVNPEQHYVVPRTEELTEFIKRVKEGRYIVIFAPRQRCSIIARPRNREQRRRR